jgi:Vitamin K-dependent gamma-carboxylase
MEPTLTYRLILILASVGCLIASLELLALREQFEDGGLFSWDVLRTISRATLSLGTGRSKEWISHPLFVPAVTGARALAVLVLIFFSNYHALSTVCVLVTIAAGMVMFLRAPVGLDGSDQMSLITFVAVAIYKLFPGDVHVAQASLWFIAIQGCLAYFVAGIAKVISPVWRSGEAVRRILGTRTYGSGKVASLVSGRDGVCVVLSWFLMLFECTFPLALAFGKTGFAVFAVLGIMFHVTNAVIMGLNTFVWAFIATYPAILFCAMSLGR